MSASRTVVVSQGDTSLRPGDEWCFTSVRDIRDDHRVHQGSEAATAMELILFETIGPCFVLELGPGTPAEGFTALKERLDAAPGSDRYWLPKSWGCPEISIAVTVPK